MIVYRVFLKDIIIKLFTKFAHASIYLKSSKKVQRVKMRSSYACNLAQIFMRQYMSKTSNIFLFFS